LRRAVTLRQPQDHVAVAFARAAFRVELLKRAPIKRDDKAAVAIRATFDR
jgi:hypothetical protein